MSLAGTVSSRSDIESNDEQAWKALFQSFLEPKGLGENDYEVQVRDNEIVIAATSAQVQLILEEIFSSPEHTRQSLSYSLKEFVGGTGSVDAVSLKSPNIDINQATAANVLTRIFSEDVLFDCGLSNKILKTHDNRAEKTLAIPIPTGQGYEDLWKGRLAILTHTMYRAGIKGLSAAYLKQDAPIELNQFPLKTDITLSSAFQDVIGIRKGQSGPEFFIRYERFLNLLVPQPPEVFGGTNPLSSLWNFHINKQDALNYLSRTFQEGFMLHRDGAQLRPIYLPRENLVKSKNLVSLVLDCSTSMSEVFSQYIIHVKSLVQEIIAKSSPGDVIRVVDFASESHSREFILSGNKDDDIKNIRIRLDSLTADGSTELYRTTLQELQALTNYTDFVESIIIFTDGHDNNSTHQKEQEFLTNYSAAIAKPAHLVPSVFTMGIGSYNKALLEKWSAQSGVPHTHLKTINDFKSIHAHLEKMRRSRLLINFMQNMVERWTSVYEGALVMPQDVTIDPSQSFTIANRTYQASPKQSLAATTTYLEEPSKTYEPMRNAKSTAATGAVNDDDVSAVADVLKKAKFEHR